jgi:hypothetical protein
MQGPQGTPAVPNSIHPEHLDSWQPKQSKKAHQSLQSELIQQTSSSWASRRLRHLY